MNYHIDFINYWWKMMGIHKNQEKAYYAAEDEYKRQNPRATKTRYTNFESFIRSYRYHLKKNKHKL
jgi:hypothetical protein